MTFDVGTGSCVMIYIPSFIKIGSGIQMLMLGDTQTHRQHGDRISLLQESKLTKTDTKTVDRACLIANAISPPPSAFHPHINVTRAGCQVIPVRYQDVFYKIIILWYGILYVRNSSRIETFIVIFVADIIPPPKRGKLWKELVYIKWAEIKIQCVASNISFAVTIYTLPDRVH
jgi:hypothetical protein